MTRAAHLADDVLLTADGRVIADVRDAEVVELRTLLREHLTGLDGDARRRIVEGLAEARSAQPAKLRHGLHHLREALRDRFPILDELGGAERGLHVDGLLRLDERAFYVYGWAFDRESQLRSLAVLTPEGETIELSGQAFRHAHADVDALYSGAYPERAGGFVCFFQTRRPDPLAEGWVLISRNGEGVALEARAPAVADDPYAAREMILSHLRHDRDGRLIGDHVHPAISRIQQALVTSAAAG